MTAGANCGIIRFMLHIICISRLRIVASIALLFSVHLWCQSPTAELRGRVLDESGAPVAKASVSAVQVAGSADPAAVSVSSESGEFVLRLVPGTYAIRIAADGFKPVLREVDVAETDLSTYEFVLSISERIESITVTETPAYQVEMIESATKTATALRDIPQSITVISHEQIHDQMMMSIGDVVRYTPGITAVQGENNRDQIVIRGNSSSADFFVNGIRDDVQYYRDLYNLERVEALKGPNAMIFGRGGGGGIVNRVTKEAGFMPLRELTLSGGSFNSKRIATDADYAFRDKAAIRFNGMYENSGTFRDFVDLERYGINPTATFAPSNHTKIVTGFEYFRDNRVADRGIPSYRGRPANVPTATFYGNPADSHVRAAVHLGSVAVEHQFGSVTLSNHTMIGDYDRGYQNYVARDVTPDQTKVGLSAYNNATQRTNIFNQTNLTRSLRTGRFEHVLVGGLELGRQISNNFRNTGYFDNASSLIQVAYSNPVISTPVTFRQSATDADNRISANVVATYLQDQVRISRFVQLIGGVRFDRFAVEFQDHRQGDSLRRTDRLISPRLGVVIKPLPAVSLYGNYSVSFLPSSGDQFSSLTSVTQQLKPEKFTNYEAGVKWDVAWSGARNVSITAATYQLERTNTRAPDPNDPTRIIQTGSQRSRGYEIGWSGGVTRRWKVAGGYAYQDATITSTTTSGLTGAQVAQVPHHTFSAWNNYQLSRRWGAGLGVLHRSDMFAAVDDTVTLPGYTRVDAAVFYSLSERTRFQVNVENLGGITYYLNADNNNNISPGSSRAIRAGITTRF